MKGRPADPTRARRGTGHRATAIQRAGVLVPVPSREQQLPAPPADLPPEVHELWTLAMEELAPRGLRAADYEAIRMMCMAAARHRRASARINATDVVVSGPNGPIVNPLLRVERDEAATYLRIAEQYGLTMAARLRLGLVQLAGQSLAETLANELGL